jgi:hypothetical protein
MFEQNRISQNIYVCIFRVYMLFMLGMINVFINSGNCKGNSKQPIDSSLSEEMHFFTSYIQLFYDYCVHIQFYVLLQHKSEMACTLGVVHFDHSVIKSWPPPYNVLSFSLIVFRPLCGVPKIHSPASKLGPLGELFGKTTSLRNIFKNQLDALKM